MKRQTFTKKVEPNFFHLRLYEWKKPVYDLAKKRRASVNDVILDFIKTSLEKEA